MRLLNKDSYVSAIDSQSGLKIEHGNSRSARKNGYHLAFSEAFSHPRGKLSICEKDKNISIFPGESIVFKSKEYLHIPANCFGFCFNRVWNSVRELSMDTTFVDPGYEGKVHIVIKNNGSEKFKISLEEPICKLVIFNVTENSPDADVSTNRDDIRIFLDGIDQNIARVRERDKGRKRLLWGGYFLILAILFGAAELYFYNTLPKDEFLSITQSIVTLAVAIVFIPITTFINTLISRDGAS